MNTASHPTLELGSLFTRFALRLLPRSPRAELHVAPALRLSLSADEVSRFDRPRGTSVTCLQGCLWLTQDGHCKDVILSAGETHYCDGDTRLFVSALSESRLLMRGTVHKE